jgi:signal transduction histidine kinase
VKLKHFLFFVFLALIICSSSCAAAGKNHVLQDIIKEWTEIEKLFAPTNEEIEQFRHSILSYLDSEMYRIYRLAPYSPGILVGIQEPNEIQEIHYILDLTFSLVEALSLGDQEKARLISADISSNLMEAMVRSTEAEEYAGGAYIRLFLVFILIIILAAVLILSLNKELSRSIKREKNGAFYSHTVLQAQENERRRIALELHDTVAQDLWRLSFQTDSIDKAADPLERNRLCGEVVAGQKSVMQRIRTICDSLIPPDFQRRGLVDALRSLCYDFQQRTGIECQLAADEMQVQFSRLKPKDIDIQLHCFRIVQECLTNIEKHAGATGVQVFVRSHADENLVICVSDNGVGFPNGFTPPDRENCLRLRAKGHYGLWGMHERVVSLSGTLTIDSESGEGTVITLQIPVLLEGSQ